MVQDLADDCRVFDASDNLHGATAAVAGLDIDVEHPL